MFDSFVAAAGVSEAEACRFKDGKKTTADISLSFLLLHNSRETRGMPGTMGLVGYYLGY